MPVIKKEGHRLWLVRPMVQSVKRKRGSLRKVKAAKGKTLMIVRPGLDRSLPR